MLNLVLSSLRKIPEELIESAGAQAFLNSYRSGIIPLRGKTLAAQLDLGPARELENLDRVAALLFGITKPGGEFERKPVKGTPYVECQAEECHIRDDLMMCSIVFFSSFCSFHL